MRGYKINLEKNTLANTYFRHVVFTAPHSQLVLMCLKPLEEIGMEVHPDNDQFLRFESGIGKAIIDSEEFDFEAGDGIIVPAGSYHNIINTSATEELKLYTIYSPAHHPDGTIHKTKMEAIAAEKEEH
ncbi:MAG TPA: cupin domain-containing protein [Alphaproteobacteria bacterium]|jgi:mannose-6-phosphate isomerase-like protein (cupin superfamily)|nr:cupin domain-containing protein [Alphaproteobacteria bacterium]